VASGARGTHPVGWTLGEARVQLPAASPNGLHIETCNAGNVLVAPIAVALRFKGGKPATLLLIEARQKHIHLTM
jgi:hypothetical protein